MDKNKILVIIPAFNEENNIVNTIKQIKSLSLVKDILVINDGSSDQTAANAKEEGVFVVSLPYNLGIGAAVQAGFQFAYKKDYEYVIRVDADGQHDVNYINDLLVPVLNRDADIAIGSRFIKPFTGYQSSFVRRVGINFFAQLLSFLTSQHITDPTSGFQALNRKALKVFSKYYPNDFPEPEAIVVAGRYKLKIKEIPVKMNKRASGSSSIRYLKTLYYMIKVTFAILLDKIKTKKGID